jgi:D-glycero-D-manno-heptose 1,7-bisphosphate phosphatase
LTHLTGVSRGRRAVFLDRDGVLLKLLKDGNISRPPRSIHELELAGDAPQALERLRSAGFARIVITNQPDIARGKVEEHVVRAMHEQLRSRLSVDAVYFCPHDNEQECECRKPKPGLILQAAAEQGLDLIRSCLIGDRWVDLGAAEAAGIDGILLQAPHSWHPTSIGPPPQMGSPQFTGRSLTECVDFVLASSRYQ